MENFKLHISIEQAVRKETSYNERWGNFEKGLITAWESGRLHRDSIFKELIEPLRNGALPKLGFKGGHNQPIKKETYIAKYKYRYGTFNYLAQRQGILNEDLDIDTLRDNNIVLTCSVTGLKTIFSTNQDKYKDAKTFNTKVPNEFV